MVFHFVAAYLIDAAAVSGYLWLFVRDANSLLFKQRIYSDIKIN